MLVGVAKCKFSKKEAASMFMGEFKHSLDKKNRLFIPSNFRKKSMPKKIKIFILTRGLEGCLYLYSPETFNAITEKVRDLPVENKMEVRAFKRILFSGATEVEPDAQGRVLVPHQLVEHAGLKSDVLIFGVDNRIELWEESRWNEYKKYADMSFTNVSKNLEF